METLGFVFAAVGALALFAMFVLGAVFAFMLHPWIMLILFLTVIVSELMFKICDYCLYGYVQKRCRICKRVQAVEMSRKTCMYAILGEKGGCAYGEANALEPLPRKERAKISQDELRAMYYDELSKIEKMLYGQL